MPHAESLTRTPLSFQLLPKDIRQSSRIGAEVILPSDQTILDLERLTEVDKDTLREAVFENSVVVIRNQQGINPATLPELTKIFDPTASDIHSAGVKAVSDPRNILSSYRAGRIPRAPQVSYHITHRWALEFNLTLKIRLALLDQEHSRTMKGSQN